MSNFWNIIAVAPLYLLNKLPLRVLYVLSDVLYLLLYYIIRYRRGVVRSNLCKSFPERSKKELRAIERDFYHRFCDYFMETIKYYGMSAEEVRKHIEFTGLDELSRMLDNGHSCVCYMLHTFNWEFITSLPLFIQKENVVAGAIYHKLRNPFFDNIFKKMRAQYGADNVTMKNTLRRVIEVTNSGRKFIYGFMADQLPKIEAMNHWVTFLNQETAVFTGAEKIARRVKASAFYVNITRVKRGKYVVRFELMVEDASTLPENELTNEFFRMGEEDLRREPASWLWTHNRWKRTRAHKEAFDRHIAMRKQEMAAKNNPER
ncbi:MAG: lysophospholipid acyltransferase family protein [Bacteroidaceae bacterium]|nr:lysophospholipid acyltransferase family protein [Bacteroidaceae bacterium]